MFTSTKFWAVVSALLPISCLVFLLQLGRPLDPLCDRVHGLVDLVVALLDEVVLPLLQPGGFRLALLSSVGDYARP